MDIQTDKNILVFDELVIEDFTHNKRYILFEIDMKKQKLRKTKSKRKK